MRALKYSPYQKALHWLLFLLVIGLYILTFGADLFPRGDVRIDTVWWLHISFGLILAALVVWRVALRLSRGAPPLPSSMTLLEIRAAKFGHLLLYALLITIPTLGIFLTWLRGDQLSLFGLFTIPSPIAANKDLAHNIRELHSLCANAILIVAGLHALAALWHHFVKKDDVLTRMLPTKDLAP